MIEDIIEPVVESIIEPIHRSTPLNILSYNPLLWFDSADQGTLSLEGAAVQEWKDKSGNDYHVTPFLADSVPTYQEGGILCQNNFLRATGNPLANKSFDLFIVVKDNSPNQTTSYFTGTGYSNTIQESLFIGVGGSTSYVMGTTTSQAEGNVKSFTYIGGVGETNIFRYRLSESEGQQFFANGIKIEELAFNSLLQGNKDFYIGAGQSDGSYQRTKNAHIYEIIAIPATNNEIIEDIQEYLAKKWNVVKYLNESILSLNPAVWYDISDESTLTHDGVSISAVEDKSNNTNNLSLLEGQLLKSSINGLTAISSSDSPSVMSTSPFSAKSCFAILNFTSTDGLEIAFLGSDTGVTKELFFRPSNNGEVSFDGGVPGEAAGKYSINNAPLSLSTSNANNLGFTAGNIIVYAQFDEVAELSKFFGRSSINIKSNPTIGELVWFNRNLDEIERSRIYNYLVQKYSL